MSWPRIEREFPVVLAQWRDTTRFLRVGYPLPGLGGHVMKITVTRIGTETLHNGKQRVTHLLRQSLESNGVPTDPKSENRQKDRYTQQTRPSPESNGCPRSTEQLDIVYSPWVRAIRYPALVWWPQYLLNTDFTLEVVQNWSEFSSVEPKLEDWHTMAWPQIERASQWYSGFEPYTFPRGGSSANRPCYQSGKMAQRRVFGCVKLGLRWRHEEEKET
ncbi:hypothetical protein DFH08DRAFT_825366 [Mycena albidolilacea]|uniref:Uncharacterized protein n=1 Tax=Mycena albidolilacea TaxID=1033008 RepID=A0AAD7EA66_9AGAR|nr:hypothetical protein DFH08DRAFT_825366 [Mycena albidolilacea]